MHLPNTPLTEYFAGKACGCSFINLLTCHFLNRRKKSAQCKGCPKLQEANKTIKELGTVTHRGGIPVRPSRRKPAKKKKTTG